jgi:AcrR family transcriptional regulator
MPSITRNASKTRDRRRPEITRRLRIAIEQLLADGESFTQLSVERLTAAAGLPRSTFYLYFGDKGQLLEELAEDVVSELLTTVREWTALPPGATRTEVEAIMRRLTDAYSAHGLLMRAVVDASSYDEGVRDRFRRLVDGCAREIAEHIRTGQRHGSVRACLSPEPTAQWLTWMTERGLYQLAVDANKSRRAELADSLTTILWSALYEGAPTRRSQLGVQHRRQGRP